MKKLLSILVGSALVFALFALVAPTFASVVGTNGGFELGTDPGVFATLSSGDSTSISGWNVASGSVDYIGTYWQASDGTRSIDLNGNEAGSISQTIPTVVGATYAVNFHLSGNPDLATPNVKTVRVSATGGTPASQDFSYDITAKANTKADMKWESDTFTFVASSTSTTVTFASMTDGAAGPALDNVSIEETLPVTQFTLTYTAGANGTITGTSPQTVDQGASGTAVTAVPNSGFHFVNWSDASTANPRTDTNVQANISVTANFAADTVVTHTITASAGANGSISPSGAVVVNDGNNQTFTITADSGFQIDNVMVDSTSVGAVGAYTFNNVTADHTISASFVVIPTATGPTDKDQCKKGGWMSFTNPSFKNQGQCVSFVERQKAHNDADNKDEDDDSSSISQSTSVNSGEHANVNLGAHFNLNLSGHGRSDD